MKRKAISILLAAALTCCLAGGTGSAAQAADRITVAENAAAEGLYSPLLK